MLNIKDLVFQFIKEKGCKGIETGLTVEVHWVYSSCDIEPGPTLESCLARNCKNPILRVESQVFLLVNDDNAQSFEPYSKLVKQNNYHQTADLPSRENAVEYLGSTTGPNYNKYCSPYEVSWSVNPKCSELNIKSLDNFCKKNVFKEKYSHGVRNLVIDPKMLSTIGK